MDTKIKIKTWVCQSCGAHQDAKNKGICFSCKELVILEVDVNKQATATIKGIEEIGEEIVKMRKEKKDRFQEPLDLDVFTKKTEDEYIAKRTSEIQENINKMKELKAE